jgi:hypothetical protein
MIKIKTTNITIILLVLLFCGCTSLKTVNEFASTSLKSVNKYEDINYSFRINCMDDCQNNKLKDLNDNLEDCDCRADAKADSVTKIIYNAVRVYFDGLTNLSNDELTNYNLDSFSKSLSDNKFGSIRIDQKEAEAYSNISGILLRAITNGYRSSRIKEYIKEANEPIKILTEKLGSNLSDNLTGKIEIQKQKAELTCFKLIHDTSLSTYEKRRVIKEYFESIEKMQKIEDGISVYTKGLKKVAEGHQKLYGNLDKLDKDELKEQLSQYGNEIKDIITEFNRLGK